jgi:acyl carrier protein
MLEAEIYARLTEIFRDIFMREDMVLTPELSAKDVKGWDSFKQIEIIIGVEETFGVKFRMKEIERLRDVGDLASLIAMKSSGANQ